MGRQHTWARQGRSRRQIPHTPVAQAGLKSESCAPPELRASMGPRVSGQHAQLHLEPGGHSCKQLLAPQGLPASGSGHRACRGIQGFGLT